ncbi:MAG: carbamoyltransferase HypF [Thermodesulfobacteriota bacterium]
MEMLNEDRPLIQDPMTNHRTRRHLVLTGVLQGIGCRPTVYRLATRIGLAGWVINTTSGVLIEIEGTAEQCDAFTRELPAEIPFPGTILTTTVREIPAQGETSFRIESSRKAERSVTPIPPDVAVCPECVEELLDPSHRRYLYPFTTCTLCGPRFTVVRSFPYDRERTSMADFRMCPQCLEEYHDPGDRRFHSQTNSCPECGPRLSLVDRHGNPLRGDPVTTSIGLLREGNILAIKGIGGFHLACNALDRDAVGRLRERKGRLEKPFAVMMPDLETVGRFCRVNTAEHDLLVSPVAPIVLLEVQGRSVAENVAPFVGTLGVVLPYSPLHHLLLRHPEVPTVPAEVLVMTSGNRSEEPIARDNREAFARLHDLADAFLVHDREIVLRADDSICRVIAGRRTVFRRSRGLVPSGFPVPEDVPEHSPVILGAGGDLKNCLAIAAGKQVVPGPHVGDLASPVGQEYFRQSVSVLTGYLETQPNVVALDPHPEYFSNHMGHELNLAVEEVFHHHAHAVSLLFEHGITGPALFAVFDGTGYGLDGTIWGGEFLVADPAQFSRRGHLGAFPLPGGEAAIREPVRILAGLLAQAGGGEIPPDMEPVLGDRGVGPAIWLEAVKKGINAPWTTSAGRLFDAAAAAAGFRRPVTFEGEAAMWLEAVADPEEEGEYPFLVHEGDPLVLDSATVIGELVKDVLGGTPEEVCAARFHNTLARAISVICRRLADSTGLHTVGLTGGCFQNRLLTEKAVSCLDKVGLRTLLHESIPPNDGGIAVGQVVAARARRSGG